MFEPKVYIGIGNTGDDNEYPILHDKDGDTFQDRYKVGIPMDDYNAITAHFDSIDDRLHEMEQSLGIKSESWFSDETVEEWWKQLSIEEMLIIKERWGYQAMLCTDVKEHRDMYAKEHKPSVIEWLYSNKGISDYLHSRDGVAERTKEYLQVISDPRPEEKFNAEYSSTWLKDFGSNDVPEWGLSYQPEDVHWKLMSPEVKESNRRFGIFKANEMQQKYYNYGILIHEGNESKPDGCELVGIPNTFGNPFGSLLGDLGSVGDIFTPEIKLPDTVDIKTVIGSDYLNLTTWIHSIVDGVHREQQFTVQKHIGSPPPTFQQPVLNNPWEGASMDDVIDYCDKIILWKQREIDVDEYWIQRNKIIQQAHTEALVEIEACLKNGKIYVRETFGTGYGQGEKLTGYDINPWAYWVSPEASVRPVFQNLLKPVNSGSGSIYRGM